MKPRLNAKRKYTLHDIVWDNVQVKSPWGFIPHKITASLWNKVHELIWKEVEDIALHVTRINPKIIR